MKINSELDAQLATHLFKDAKDTDDRLLKVAAVYASTEHAIAVLSNLRQGVSHIYYGGVAAILGIAEEGTYQRVDTIWEKEILSRVHPDDLEEKQLLELQFLYFVQQKKELTWRMESILRMSDDNGTNKKMLHRIIYFSDGASNSIDYALCLYSFACEDFCGGRMVNMLTGEQTRLEEQDYSNLLSAREKEVLQLISQGMLSKEIADKLCISINTVNRHRQNILQHLQVSNSMEACKRASELGLL